MLIDRHHRTIDYLRVSVTDRCDLRCTYCLPKGFKDYAEPAHWLTHAEMARLVGLFLDLGVSKVRLTGGEPLLRRGVAGLAAALFAHHGLRDLSLSTNGTQLARHAPALHAAGVRRLNVSLDTLDRGRFAAITGRDCLDDVLAGLRAAEHAGFSPIKINMVVQAGVNEADIDAMLARACERGWILRLIEPMPIGHTGRAAAGVDLTRTGEALAQRHSLLPQVLGRGTGPARYWRDPRSGASLGVITPMSRHFCVACNRVRLGVDGTLYLCLGQEDSVPLGRLLRQGLDDAALKQAIVEGIAAKPERHDFLAAPQKIVRFMSQTGG